MENNHEDSGWVIKAPFTCNSQYIRFTKTITDTLRRLEEAFCYFDGSMPYMILQACMNNRREMKVFAINGEPCYKCNIPGTESKRSATGVNEAFVDTSDERLMCFVKKSIKVAQASCPYLLKSGLFRVDVFQKANGELVVNEFESLEANHNSKKMGDELFVGDFLTKYWKVTLLESMKKYLVWNG